MPNGPPTRLGIPSHAGDGSQQATLPNPSGRVARNAIKGVRQFVADVVAIKPTVRVSFRMCWLITPYKAGSG